MKSVNITCFLVEKNKKFVVLEYSDDMQNENNVSIKRRESLYPILLLMT